MASVRTDSIPAAQPEPATARQASKDRPAVCAAGLAKSYGPMVALAGLDLHVAAGETVALLGPNGPGRPPPTRRTVAPARMAWGISATWSTTSFPRPSRLNIGFWFCER